MIRLTQRDINLMRWINEVGFATNEHIALCFQFSQNAAYKRAARLIKAGYLLHDHVFHGVPGVYRLSQKGIYVSGSHLPRLHKIPIATYYHDLAAIKLGLTLVNQLGGKFTPERVLRYEEGQNRFGLSGHITDGLLAFDDKEIAIEIELNKKSKRRRDQIFKHYLYQVEFDEIWYFCGNAEIEKQMQPYLEKSGRFKLYRLDAALSGQFSLSRQVSQEGCYE